MNTDPHNGKSAWEIAVDANQKAAKAMPPVAGSAFVACAGCSDPEECIAMDLCVTRIHEEAHQERVAYIKAGVCGDCGACSAKEAETKCTPRRDCCDEYSCAGEELWDEQNSALSEPRSPHNHQPEPPKA